MDIAVALRFDKGYIANPYWPAVERLITLRKQSGVDRARSEAKRQAALKAHLERQGMTMDDYLALERSAARPFHTVPSTDEIVIPAHQLHGFCAAAAAIAPAAVRLTKVEQIRTILECGDLLTGKYKADGTYERFISNPLTNQRRLQTNEYIENFTATGRVHLTNDDLLKQAENFFRWGGREVGVGACRKMGWGRFELIEWKAA